MNTLTYNPDDIAATVKPLEPTGDMPAPLAEALVRVLAGITPVRKGDENKHANYNYASTDDFFEMVGPLLAKEGVLIISNEINHEFMEVSGRNGGRTLLVVTYEFYLVHKSGARWVPPREMCRSVNVDAGSPQAWGQAQSYVEKQFLRALFKIPAHDPREEADAVEPFRMEPAPQTSRRNGTPTRRRRAPTSEEPAPPSETPAASEGGTDIELVFSWLEDALAVATTLEHAEEDFAQFKTVYADVLDPASAQRAADMFRARVKDLMAAKPSRDNVETDG